ncbi:hypothetical protein SDC9_99144 [bioreactor metagenome]|uniref:Uncharacterized protein n=1 Tax=bioreactor metagenome TaxID=1076179 RepID=A0A645AGR3_9ZZZZ
MEFEFFSCVYSLVLNHHLSQVYFIPYVIGIHSPYCLVVLVVQRQVVIAHVGVVHELYACIFGPLALFFVFFLQVRCDCFIPFVLNFQHVFLKNAVHG